MSLYLLHWNGKDNSATRETEKKELGHKYRSQSYNRQLNNYKTVDLQETDEDT